MSQTTSTTLDVQGLQCEGCAAAARAALQKLPGVTQVECDLPRKTVTVTHDAGVDREAAALALTRAGFPAQ